MNQLPQQPKKQPKTFSNESILESLRNLGGSVGDTVARDVVGKVGSDALTSIFGSPAQSGEFRPMKKVDVGREIYEPTIPRQEAARAQPIRLEETNLKQQIEAVRSELKALAASVKSLSAEIHHAVETAPVDPGINQLNIFERLRSVLAILREQIDDSRSWLALSAGRKQKKNFWGMYKKHGTQFGLSSERTTATQAG